MTLEEKVYTYVKVGNNIQVTTNYNHKMKTIKGTITKLCDNGFYLTNGQGTRFIQEIFGISLL